MSSRTGRGTVPCGPLAEAIEAKGTSCYAIALRLGWEDRARRGRSAGPDSYRVKRRLGLAGVAGRIQQHMDYDTAVAIARAAYIDPVEVGL